MKAKSLSALAGLGSALILSDGADAAFVGLAAELHTTVTIGTAARDVYRVYAYFNSPSDKVFSFGAGSSLDPMVLQNILADGTTLGGGFFNAGLGGTFAPTQYNIDTIPATEWDSFFTVGPWIADDASPETYSVSGVGLPAGNQPAGNSFSTTGQILGVDLDSGLLPEYTAAGPDLRVGLMQLTVNSGQYVAGTVSLVYTSGGPNIPVLNQHFVPGPFSGVLVLVGIAGIIGTRRRRA